MRPIALLACLAICDSAFAEEQGCTFTVSPLTIVAPAAGGSGQVAVTTAAGCAWTASSDKPWITVGAGGVGSGSVNWTASANSGALQRLGSLTIAGRSVFVTQLQSTGTPFIPGVPGVPGAPSAAPGAPRQLAANVGGNGVTMTWSPPDTGGAPSSYVLSVGSVAGWSNIASFPTGNTQTSFSASNVPNGHYFVRVSAQNSGGTSPASNEVSFSVPQSCTTAPGAPSMLRSSVSGLIVTLTWDAPSSGAAPTGYAIEAGSGPSLANIAIVNIGSSLASFTANAVPGSYFVRVRAQSVCGSSPPSEEVGIIVR